MKIKRTLSTFVSILVTAILMCAVPVAADIRTHEAAAAPAGTAIISDIDSHWAASAIETCRAYGIVFGEGNGLYAPDCAITYIAFAAMINRAFGYHSLAGYTDIPEQPWYAKELYAAETLGFLADTSNGNTAPEDEITREQAAVMLAKVLRLRPAEAATEAASAFTDFDDVSAWAADAVLSMAQTGYIAGYQGLFMPQRHITRGEAAQLLCNIFGTIADDDLANGFYHHVTIRKPGITLRGLTIQGDLFITEGVGDGDILLDNVHIDGRLLIAGGGTQTISMRNTTAAGGIIIDKPSAAGGQPVRLCIAEMNGAMVMHQGTARQIVIDEDISILCETDSVTLSVFSFQPSEDGAAKPVFTINKNASIDAIIANKPAVIDGDGAVSHMQVNTSGLVIGLGLQFTGTNMTVAEGIGVQMVDGYAAGTVDDTDTVASDTGASSRSERNKDKSNKSAHSSNPPSSTEPSDNIKPPTLMPQAVLAISEPGFITYGDSTFALSATGGSGSGAVTYSVETGTDILSISGDTVTLLKAGTATIRATKAGDQQYLPISSAPLTITVRKRDLSRANITVSGVFVYDGGTHAPIPSIQDNGLINATDYTVTYANHIRPGTATVTVTATADGNYVGSADCRFNIEPRPVYITGLGVADKTYDGTTAAQITGVPTLTGIIGGETVTIQHGDASFSDQNAGESKPVVFYGWSIGGSHAGHYLLAAQPSDVMARIVKAPGATVGTPTVNITAAGSFTLHAVSAPSNGQAVAYAISATNNADPALLTWNTGQLTFDGLITGATYYAYARSASDMNYEAGTASVSAPITIGKNRLTINDPSSPAYANPNGHFLTPVANASHTERTAVFTVEVSGFTDNNDAYGVGLTVTGLSGLSVAGHDTVGNAVNGVKTFTVTVTLADNADCAAGTKIISITGLTGVPAEGYEPYGGGEKNVSVRILDGKTPGRAIPITQANFEAFNAYAGTGNGLALHYVQTEDINANRIQWTPIGTDSNSRRFTGSYDGGSYSVNNLTLSSSSNTQGFFGCIGDGGLAANITLTNAGISGAYYTGGIAGVIRNGTVRGCDVTGQISGSYYIGGIVGNNIGGTTENCRVNGRISSNNDYAGGIVGYNNGGTVAYCVFEDGHVSGFGNVGGITGFNFEGSIQRSYAKGTVTGTEYIGGIAGANTSNSFILHGYTTADVTASGMYAGGITGNNGGMVQYCYATGVVTGGGFFGYIGGIAGANDTNGTIANCAALGARVVVTTSATWIGRIIGDDAGGMMSDNYARSDMPLMRNNTVIYPGSNDTTYAHNQKNGASTTEYTDPYWWRDTVRFPENAWDFGYTPPMLKGSEPGLQQITDEPPIPSLEGGRPAVD